MASLALSVVGSAIGGPFGGMVGGFIGGLLDNMLFPVKSPAPPQITSSTYGMAIPLLYGPQCRVGCNMIWSSGWRKQTGKAAKLANLKGLPPAYVCDAAFAIAQGPIDPNWAIKIWANGNVLFDSTLATSPPTPDANGVTTWTSEHETHKDFHSLVVYSGNAAQNPDPTIEANLGVGQATAYRGTAYFVLNALLGTPFGNAVPTMQVLTRANGQIRLNQVVTDIIRRAGVDPTLYASTSSLSTLVEGYAIESQTDGVAALQPLALVYDFDVAEVGGTLRFTARGNDPLATIESARLAGHEYGGARPSFEWPREPEMQLPKVAALTFVDPARDCQDNTQSAKRDTGSSASILQTRVGLTLTSATARKVADRMLWEAHLGRQTLSAQTDDRLVWLEAANNYKIEVPFGYETIRITKRTRGANGVIEFEGKRDAPSLYGSSAPGASADSQANALGLGGPVNPPIFIEPPANFPGITGATVLIALSGGDGTTANDAWGGCSVYVATDDVTGDYQLAGLQSGVSNMGKLDASLASFSSSNPDNTHTLAVDMNESAGEPQAQSATDAADSQLVCYVDGEYIAIETVSGAGGGIYNCTHLWRGRYGTSGGAHASGTAFAQCDASLFRFPLASIYVGRVLYFRFVSAGENLANAATYTYTPRGVVASASGSTASIIASEALAAGQLVNLWTNAGVVNMRKANATDTTKPADGYVKAAVSMGASGLLFTGGANDQVSGLTPGATYYLDTTAGGITATAPAVTGEGVQQVGKALSATELLFSPGAIVAVP